MLEHKTSDRNDAYQDHRGCQRLMLAETVGNPIPYWNSKQTNAKVKHVESSDSIGADVVLDKKQRQGISEVFTAA